MSLKRSDRSGFIATSLAVMAFFTAAFTCCIWQARSVKQTYAIDPEARAIVATNTSTLSSMFSRKVVLLSFDDGPENTRNDHAILAILKKHGAQSIWMVNCKNLDPGLTPNAAVNRNTLSEIAQAGHVIGNHGYHHYNLQNVERDNPEQLKNEIAGCSDYLQAIRGEKPKYFRAPWGVLTEASADIAQSAGMTNLPWSRTLI